MKHRICVTLSDEALKKLRKLLGAEVRNRSNLIEVLILKAEAKNVRETASR